MNGFPVGLFTLLVPVGLELDVPVAPGCDGDGEQVEMPDRRGTPQPGPPTQHVAFRLDAQRAHRAHTIFPSSLLRRLDEGEWQAGETLPQMEKLAKHYDASRNAVARAVGKLAKEGRLVSVPR